MLTNKELARINELAHKKKSEGLTEAELAEQQNLHQLYLASVRENFRAQVENIEIVDGKLENESNQR